MSAGWNIYDLCDDPDGVAAAIAAADQLKASLRDATLEQVRQIARDPKYRDTPVRMLAVREVQRREARS